MNPASHVVCINDQFHPAIAKLYVNLPKKDLAYVVRDVLLGVSFTGIKHGTVRLLLVGLHNPCAGTSLPPNADLTPTDSANSMKFKPKTPEEIEAINRERKRALYPLQAAAEIFVDTGSSLGASHVDQAIANICRDGCDEY